MSITRLPDGTYSYAFSMTAAELYAAIGQLDMTQLAKDAGQGTTTTPPPPPPPPPSTGFKGIFAFNNMANPSLFVDNPSVAGTTLTRYWAELNPAQGQYTWDVIDKDMAPWVAAGKQVILRVSTAGWTKWQPAQHSQQGTPQWVLDQGVPSVKANDGAIKPQYWHLKFLNALSDFVKAFAVRYDGNAHIAAIEIGVGDGGETKPDTTKDSNVLSRWQNIGYTDANWWGAIQGIIMMYVEAFKQTPLILMPDASFLGGTKGYDESLVVNFAAKYSVWLQWNGLVSGAKLPGSFSGLPKNYPLLLEPLNAAGQNNRKLADDLQTAMSFVGVHAVLVFNADLADPKNADALARVAAMVAKTP